MAILRPKGAAMKVKFTAILGAAALLLAACHTSIRETEPSAAFRSALEEVMLRQPNNKKIKPDELARRKGPVVLALSLDDCIELAMVHNRAVLFEQLNAEIAGANLISSRANLDFTIGASVGYSRETQELQNRIFGDSREEEINAVTNVGVTATLPFATGTTVIIDGTFIRNDSNSPFQAFEFFPAATLTVRQHLLNGFGFVPNLGNRRIAEGNRSIADWQVQVTRNDQAFVVAMAYWNLVEAREELSVFERQKELAEESLELARSRFEAEIGTRLDVLAQEANLKSQDVSIIVAQALVGQRTDELVQAIQPDLLHGYAMFDEFEIRIETKTSADTARTSQDSVVLLEEVKAALRRRPEIKQARQRILNSGIDVEMGEYGLLPTLDLETFFGTEGFGKEFDDSLESFNKFENLRYGFRVNFGVPIQNSAARGTLMRAELNKRAALLSARDMETGIILEVAKAVRDIRSARQALESASEALTLQRETHTAEIERQRAGLATSFEERQAANELRQAELNELKARVGLQRSKLALQKATGELSP